MQENKYKQLRQAVIDLFNRYVKHRDEFWQSLNLSDGLDDETVADVQKEVDKIKANKYLLAIVGESKSGKSAFINALLGKPVLPTGVLQCTSGIIEIVDTDNDQDKKKVYLKVTYADQPEIAKVEYEDSSGSDTTPLQKRLSEIAAIKEEYRSLPTFQLNQHLIEKKPERITNLWVQQLSQYLLKEKGNNPHNLSKEEFERRIAKYLEEYKDLSQIPVAIQVGYPMELKFAHIRIVDTPGVNARGGLKNATIRYIKTANAVIFIHLFKNIASESLQNFFNKSVPKQAYKNIFMFLTHKAHATKEDVQATLAEAQQLFPDIKAGRIVIVDSMLKQVSDEFQKEKSDELRKKLLKVLLKEEEKKKLLSPYIVDFGHEVEEIQPAIFKDSNFSTVQNLLTTFSEQALRGQLRWVVTQVAEGYGQQQKDYAQKIGSLRRKTELTKAPEQFDSEIDTLKGLLDDYQLRLKDFSLKKQKKYKGRHSAVNIKFSTMKDMYNKILGNARDEDEIRKHVMDFNTDCEKEVTSRTSTLRLEYEAEMEQVGATFETKHLVSPPKINLESISEKAKNQAYETITIPGDREERTVVGAIAGGILGGLLGFAVGGPVGALIGTKVAAGTAAVGAVAGGAGEYLDSTPTQTVSRFNDEKFKSAFITEAKNLVISIADGMPEAISGLFDSYDKQFQEKLGRIIEERQAAYELLKQEKAEAEKLRQLEHNRTTVVGELKKIDNMTKQLSPV
jgi:hypothetical protein